MSINTKRSEAMRRKSDAELIKIIQSGSLSAAAAQWELDRRGK